MGSLVSTLGILTVGGTLGCVVGTILTVGVGVDLELAIRQSIEVGDVGCEVRGDKTAGVFSLVGYCCSIEEG